MVRFLFWFLQFPTMIDETDPEQIKLRLAATVRFILEGNKTLKAELQASGRESFQIITSLRGLSTASSVQRSALTSIVGAKKDPQFSSIIKLTEALNISFVEFATVYDSITEQQLAEIAQRLKNSTPNESDD